jgi:hypothetical protein
LSLFTSPFSGHCTLWPDIYFGVDLSLACYDHDAAYMVRDPALKVRSDATLVRDWWRAAKPHHKWWQRLAVRATAPGAYVAVATLGWLVWGWGWMKERAGRSET